MQGLNISGQQHQTGEGTAEQGAKPILSGASAVAALILCHLGDLDTHDHVSRCAAKYSESKRDARAIGVQQIDLVRVMVLDETPLPTDRDLRKFILQTGICSNKGIAFGHGIVLKTGAYYRRLIAHKLAHVMQYERFGGIEPFLVGYIPESFPPHYPNGPLEREAEQLAKTVCCSDPG